MQDNPAHEQDTLPITNSASPRNHWLCIAYAFPPINRSGTYRTLEFVRHLDALSWDATVLTVGATADPQDDALMSQVPRGCRVVRAHRIDAFTRLRPIRQVVRKLLRKTVVGGTSENRGSGVCEKRLGPIDWLSWLMQTPDSNIGWIAPAFLAGLRAIRIRRPNVLYSTSPTPSAHLIALLLSHATRISWVADFRDPWSDSPFRRNPYPSLHRIDAWLERRVVDRASRLIVNTKTLAMKWMNRYPAIADKCEVIPNGIDFHRFSNIRPIRTAPIDHFVITHAGQFYGPRSPIAWFRAIRHVLRRHPSLNGRIHLLLIGADQFEGCPLGEWAQREGIGECVEVLGAKPHNEALGFLAGSDAVMLAGTAGRGSELQVPNKLYEYLALRKPIVATCAADSPVRSIIEESHADACLCLPNDALSIADAITWFATRRECPLGDAWSGVHRFDRSIRAAELAAVFNDVTKTRASDRSVIVRQVTAPMSTVRTRPAPRVQHSLEPCDARA